MRTRRLFLVATIGLSLGIPLPLPAQARRTCFGETPSIVAAGNAGATIHGTAGDDVIVGTEGNDRIYGGRGDDKICGARGNDRIRGGKGADHISGGRNSDVPFSSSRGDDVNGGLLGNAGPDVIRGAHGVDLLKGGRGGDVLRAGADGDNDVVVVGTAEASGHGIAGGDYHASWGGKVVGGLGDDRHYGGKGNDYINSRDGVEDNDRIDGGPGANLCRSDPDPERNCPQPQPEP